MFQLKNLQLLPPVSRNVSDKNLSFRYNYLQCCVGKVLFVDAQKPSATTRGGFAPETFAQAAQRLVFGRVIIYIYGDIYYVANYISCHPRFVLKHASYPVNSLGLWPIHLQTRRTWHQIRGF